MTCKAAGLKAAAARAAVAMAVVAACFDLHAAPFDPEDYARVDAKVLKATPENYRNQKVVHESDYRGFRGNFPPFVERAGFRSTRLYWLEIAPESIPVFAAKSDAMNQLIPTLRKNSMVRVYGRIKSATVSLKRGEKGQPFSFCLEVDHMEVIAPPAPARDNPLP